MEGRSASDTQAAAALGELARHLVLEHLRPAAALIGHAGEVRYLLGPTGRYLETPPGAPAGDLTLMAPEALRPALRAAIHRAASEGAPSVLAGVQAREGGGRVTITVKPVPAPCPAEGLLLVIFQDEADPAAPPHGPAGEAVGVSASARDITGQETLERAIKQSEEQKRAILASLSAHIALLGRDGTIVAVNPAWEEFARVNGGAPDRCGVGANYLDACLNAAGPFADEAAAVVAGLRGILSGETREFSIEYPCHSETQQRWFLLLATPLRGEPGGAVVSHTNITSRVRAGLELREREEHLRAILDTAADAIITIARDGVILSVNRAAERIFGYAPAEMLGQNVRMLMPPPFRDEHDGHISRYLATRQPHIIGIGREAVARRKDGSVFPVELAITEIDHREQFTGLIRDITRRKELEREVVEIASLEQRRIGHDLHDTVLQEMAGLALMAEAMRAEPDAGLAARIAHGLRGCQRQLRAIMRGLLPVPVDSEGLMAALADLAQRTRGEGKVSCVFECPEPVAVADNLTATHLYLIAREAVHNAVRHAGPALIRITLESDGRLVLRVQDDGSGMPAPPPEGQGVGLVIMRNRAAIIGAALRIEPARPGGTVITCTLPRINDERQASRTSRPRPDRR